jgi:hypothetical protein
MIAVTVWRTSVYAYIKFGDVMSDNFRVVGKVPICDGCGDDSDDNVREKAFPLKSIWLPNAIMTDRAYNLNFPMGYEVRKSVI